MSVSTPLLDPHQILKVLPIRFGGVRKNRFSHTIMSWVLKPTKRMYMIAQFNLWSLPLSRATTLPSWPMGRLAVENRTRWERLRPNLTTMGHPWHPRRVLYPGQSLTFLLRLTIIVARREGRQHLRSKFLSLSCTMKICSTFLRIPGMHALWSKSAKIKVT